MTRPELPERVRVNPDICGGRPCIRGTRIHSAIILDGLAEGLTPEQVIDHYPQRTIDDVRAAAQFSTV